MPIFKRAAISFSADATSSAWARLSSWHGPAMIEIGKSLPNLTEPTVTTGAAEMLACQASTPFRRDHKVNAGWINPISCFGYQGCAAVHFTAENDVGTSSWLTILPTIWPSSSVLARAAIHSGSLWNAAHFFSRSASDSQAKR